MKCPKCNADISESYEPDDFSVGIVGGWYCDACDLAIGEGEVDREPREGDVPLAPTVVSQQPPTPVPEPATWTLFAVGLSALAWFSRRRDA